MPRLSCCTVLALSAAMLVSNSSAQQTASHHSTNPERQGSPAPPPGPVLGGDGTPNFIPLWTTPDYLLSSVIYQASGGNIGIGTTTPAASLDVNGDINAALTYGIGGFTVLSIGSPADQNVFVGFGAGSDNVVEQGVNNTFTGCYAGYRNTTGDRNTFDGCFAGHWNTTGQYNAFLGEDSGFSNTTGYSNTFIGMQAGYSNTTGWSNTFTGYNAGYNTTGVADTFMGDKAGLNNTTGNYDIYIANQGPSSGTESGTIRIGDSSQNATYISGIYNATVADGVPAYINSNGQIGTLTSSLRFKEQVRDMGDSSSALLKLRPVTFFYKPEYGQGGRTRQYGLIAEEVAKVYPELVAYDNQGQPYTVRYQYIATMLLNEVQKQYRRAIEESTVVEAQQKQLEAQAQEIESLKQELKVQNASLQDRLARLEGMVGREAQTVAQVKP
jgi:hypothetical protein